MNAAVGVWWVATSAAPPDAALVALPDAAQRVRLASDQEPRAARKFVVGNALLRCLAVWWTRKEAMLKLLGTGLLQQSSTVSLRLDGDAVDVSTAGGTQQRLGLRRLACRPGFVSSLATHAPVPAVEHDAAGLLDEAAHGAASA